MEGSGPSIKLLSPNLPGGTEENHKKVTDYPVSGTNFNPGTNEYEAGVPTTRQQHSVKFISIKYF
jgi:hypothetical protein